MKIKINLKIITVCFILFSILIKQAWADEDKIVNQIVEMSRPYIERINSLASELEQLKKSKITFLEMCNNRQKVEEAFQQLNKHHEIIQELSLLDNKVAGIKMEGLKNSTVEYPDEAKKMIVNKLNKAFAVNAKYHQQEDQYQKLIFSKVKAQLEIIKRNINKSEIIDDKLHFINDEDNKLFAKLIDETQHIAQLISNNFKQYQEDTTQNKKL